MIQHILQFSRAEFHERFRNLVANLVVHLLRNANAFWIGKRLEPRSNVDRVANNIIALANYVAEMNSDPQSYFPIFMGGNVVVVKKFLNFNSAIYSVERTLKLDEERATDSLYLASVEL
jgi:hypothetical protein